MSDVALPSWSAVYDAIAAQRLGVTPAELHGSLIGWFAAGGEDTPDWLARVMADDALPQNPSGNALDALRAASAVQLDDVAGIHTDRGLRLRPAHPRLEEDDRGPGRERPAELRDHPHERVPEIAPDAR